MALGVPSNLSLATLALIANDVAKTTNNTSLDACQSESGEDNCAMWASFKIASANNQLAITFSSGNFDGPSTNRGFFKIKVLGDVGEYMGGTASGEQISSELKTAVDSDSDGAGNYVFFLEEVTINQAQGSEYVSQILGNSNNAGDYQGDYVASQGNDNLGITQLSPKDSFRAQVV